MLSIIKLGQDETGTAPGKSEQKSAPAVPTVVLLKGTSFQSFGVGIRADGRFSTPQTRNAEEEKKEQKTKQIKFQNSVARDTFSYNKQ